MNLGSPVQERLTQNALTVEVNCAKIMPSRVERASRFSARPAVSCIERSTRSQHTGNVESEKEPKPTR